MGKKNKKQKQKLINKVIADGKISKSEARKLSNQGISSARVQKAQTKSFRPGNVFSRGGPTSLLNATPQSFFSSGVRTNAPDGRYQGKVGISRSMPSYSPLLIGNRASSILSGGGGGGGGGGGAPGGGGAGAGGGASDEGFEGFFFPEIEEEEEEEPEINPDAPASTKQKPVTIRNPTRRKIRGGINQFQGNNQKRGSIPLIQSTLLNV